MLLFHDLIQSIKDEKGEWDSLQSLIEERADIAIRYAFDGYGISYDDALEMLKNADDLTDEQRVDRGILVAAVDNIIDFSTAEEYQMARDIPDFDDIFDPELSDWDGEGNIDEYLESLFITYNQRYASVENMDIEYALIVAAYLAHIASETVLTYMTQGDDRVRPWHLQYEGFSAPRSHFPSWLIPPIEHQCRCFLVEDSANVMGKVQAKWEGSGMPEMPEWFNRTFKESVANGGRIFSDEHPYFQVETQHYDKLSEIASNIKKKYLSNG